MMRLIACHFYLIFRIRQLGSKQISNKRKFHLYSGKKKEKSLAVGEEEADSGTKASILMLKSERKKKTIAP